MPDYFIFGSSGLSDLQTAHSFGAFAPLDRATAINKGAANRLQRMKISQLWQGIVIMKPGFRCRSTQTTFFDWYLSINTDFTAEAQRTQRNSLMNTIKHFAFFAPLR
jgi:hypothetical protein